MDKSMEEKDQRNKMNSPNEMDREERKNWEHGSRAITTGSDPSGGSRREIEQSRGERKLLLSLLLLALLQDFHTPR